MYNVKKLLDVLSGEVGYLEKASVKDLYSKTGNAGYGNYTKYWADIKAWGLGDYQGQYWCAAFVHWCFVMAYGLAGAKELLMHAPYINVGKLYDLAQSAGRLYADPQVGDVVLFRRDQHTEVVTAVTDGAFSTIGGNTKAGTTVVPNGGGVYAKTYNLAQQKSAGTRFYRPPYGPQIEISPVGSGGAPGAPQKPTEVYKLDPAQRFDATIAGEYTVVPADGLNLRTGAGTGKQIIKTLPRGSVVRNYGYFTYVGRVKWFLVVAGNQKGFVASTSTKGSPYLI